VNVPVVPETAKSRRGDFGPFVMATGIWEDGKDYLQVIEIWKS